MAAVRFATPQPPRWKQHDASAASSSDDSTSPACVPAPIPRVPDSGSESSDDPLKDNWAPRYTVFKDLRIGTGAFSDVFRAIDTTTGAPVAVKRLLSAPRSGEAVHSDEDFSLLKRRREVSTLLLCATHENVMPMLDSFTHAGDLCLVFPYAEHGDLIDWLNKTVLAGLFNHQHHQDAVAIIDQLSSAIEHVHRHKVAHRDLKLDNILVVQTNPVVVKIIDWGLAYRSDIDGSDERARHAGSYAYAAPENLFPDEYGKGMPIDPFVGDVWSFGVVAYAVSHLEMPVDIHDLCEPFRGYENIIGPINERVHSSVVAIIKHTLVVDHTRRSSIARAREVFAQHRTGRRCTDDDDDTDCDDDDDVVARTSEWLAHHMGASASSSAHGCK